MSTNPILSYSVHRIAAKESSSEYEIIFKTMSIQLKRLK